MNAAPIGSSTARTRAAKATGAVPEKPAAPASKAASPGASKAASPGKAEEKPGAEAPEHLHASQPEGKPKMSWGDKLSTAANLAGAAGSLLPLFQGHGDNKGANQSPSDPQSSDDREQYYQAKVTAGAGQPTYSF
jgi:hypothetical protein